MATDLLNPILIYYLTNPNPSGCIGAIKLKKLKHNKISSETSPAALTISRASKFRLVGCAYRYIAKPRLKQSLGISIGNSYIHRIMNPVIPDGHPASP
jgi:hypothetical protein